MKKFNKLVALIVCFLIVCAICLVGCEAQIEGDDSTGQTDSNGFTVIRFWNGFTGKDGETMDRIVANFNEEMGAEYNMKVYVDKIPWDTLFTKITTTSSNLKAAPHIVAMSASRIANMQDRGVLRELDGVEEYLGVSASDYIPAAWNGGVLSNGKRYGFPLDVHPTAMYYNKDLISEAELPTTWEEFTTVCKAKTTGGVYGWAVPSMYSVTKDVFLNMLYTSGGHVFDSNNKAVFNSAIAVEKLTNIYNYIHGDEPISPKDVGSGGDFTLFTQGKSVFYFDGPWLINTFGLFDNPDSNIGVAPCPDSIGDGQTNFAGSHQFTLMANTVKDEKTKNLCYVFMKYVSEHSYDWALGGQVPALKSIHSTAAYQQLTALTPFTQMAYKATLGEIGYTYWYEGYNTLGVAVSNAASKIKTPKEALDKGVKDFNDWLEDETL